ncbi:MAG: pyridoxal-phosphate dependent enzyme [Bifidobacteriaceae bacterium]|jgi:cystathionine beta-synthase|nr:pyridoxal-phosphate dependent enzyme [Bifidobacteriaceae bacterium]
MRYANSVIDLIGRTPLVRLGALASPAGPAMLAKVEYLNPGGSAKDRIAAAIIETAERTGHLRPGGTIVEPTSGNTGVGLALVANLRGYRAIFTVPDKVAADKIAVLKAYGAEVVVTPTGVPPEHPDSYYSVADRLVAQIPGAFKPDQFSNPAGPEAHYATTGPEIWWDTEGAVTHFVAPIGTGGTISGAGRYLKEASGGRVQVIGADPVGSIYSDPSNLRGYLVEGAGEDFYPEAYDPSVVDRVIGVADADSFATARRLARHESLLVGGTSGMAVHAALGLARQARPSDVIVVLLPDGGRGYLRKIFDDAWMSQHGFATGPSPAAPAETGGRI